MPSGSKVKDIVRPIVSFARNRRDTALFGSCAVLLYHRVIALESDPQLLAVDPNRFDKHLSILKERYKVLTMEQFDDHLLNEKKFPKNSVLISFDDGYADNHLYARPILEKHGLQALFYIASGYMGRQQEYWWDELERLLIRNVGIPLQLAFDSNGIHLEWNFSSDQDLAVLQGHYENALEALRKIPSNDRDAILEQLRIVLNSPKPRSSHLPMTIDQLRAFAASPSVVIGAHTVGHPSLAQLSSAHQKEEIEASKRALEEILGIQVPYFSYPFGTGADFDATTEELARAAGFKHVSANYPGIVHARSPRFKFPRFLVRNWDGPEFHERMEGFFKA